MPGQNLSEVHDTNKQCYLISIIEIPSGTDKDHTCHITMLGKRNHCTNCEKEKTDYVTTTSKMIKSKWRSCQIDLKMQNFEAREKFIASVNTKNMWLMYIEILDIHID